MIEMIIAFLGGMQIDGMKFHLVDHCRTDIVGLEGGCVAWVREYNHRHIWIVSGMSLEDTILACNHEMYHIRGNRKTHPDMDIEKFESDHQKIGEDIEQLPSWVHYRECDNLAAKLVGG